MRKKAGITALRQKNKFGTAAIVPRQAQLTVESIRVYIHYNFNANAAWFDNNLMMEIAYDVRGNAIGSTLTGHRRNLAADEAFTRLVSSAGYSADGNQLVTATDVNGVTRTMAYANDQFRMRGIPSRITDGLGREVVYEMDPRTGCLVVERDKARHCLLISWKAHCPSALSPSFFATRNIEILC